MAEPKPHGRLLAQSHRLDGKTQPHGRCPMAIVRSPAPVVGPVVSATVARSLYDRRHGRSGHQWPFGNGAVSPPPPTAGCTSSTVDKTIELNRVRVAQWLVDPQLVQNYNSRHSMFAAAANGNLKALEWLMSKHRPSVEDFTAMYYMASRMGYVDVVAYLQQLQPEVQVDVISLDFAAAIGHLSMV
ncbi:hypothetical protein H257_04913 [Aphanomyces astaci]|uniref:Uncharacterized protein n=1 Tax=Aphanomyces astaci TaxID=112090 RepID=W4GTI7_APHAT|nr:hypothetical protein H257_04913 [Aphanomyces astaci]ETV82203.1 hypothetical protein H257_04913 [Aphanomyces astaci]|eukprot:XP_009827872.1 hypothetical protein H257_04913 [Aphanomyces astaci]